MSYSLDINKHLEENHAGEKAKYVKNIIYGGLDGIITTFSIIAASVGASLEMKYIVALSVANLIADALSMGLGDAISSYFENKYILEERKKEEYEYDNNKQYEIDELIDLYKSEGLNDDDAKSIVEILAKPLNKDLFLRYMLLHELGLEVPDNNPFKDGFITFCSFMLFGFIPVLFYIIFYATSTDYYTSFGVICFVSVITMFLLGAIQSYITKQHILNGGIIITINGILASGLAFIIGYGIETSIT